jgi:hypothetical protein
MALTTMLLLGAAVVGLVGLVLLFGRARKGGALLRRLIGLVLVVAAIGLGGAGVLLRNWHWLLDDVPVATIALTQQAPQRYTAVLTTHDNEPPRTFELFGDEWQLDARVIRWTLPAQLGGLRPMYRFERLSGRYGDPKQELSGRRSVHDLREAWDFWEFRQRYLADLPIADARWGSAAYLPMLDGATYAVFVNPQGGLVAMPADEATEALLDEAGW